jgi:hypothetical protein
MGLLLLILVFVFQLLAPSAHAASFMANGHANHQILMDAATDCPMHLAKMASTDDPAPKNGVTQEKCAHCVLSMCCFHITFPSSEIVTAGMLLPDSKSLDRGTLLTSSAGSSQDRPPRYV